MTLRDQRLSAIVRANEVRHEHALQKQRIGALGPCGGARLAAELVDAGEVSIKFDELLRAVPGIGPSTMRRMLGLARINGAVRVNGGVDVGRRRLLVGQLVAYASQTRRR